MTDKVVNISKIEIENHNVIIFKFKHGMIKTDEFQEFLAILEKLMDRGEPFCFIVDASEASVSLKDGMKTGKNLISWMKKNKPRVPGLILCSAVITSSTYPKITEILNWVFQKQKPVSPNIITYVPEDAYKYIEQELKKL